MCVRRGSGSEPRGTPQPPGGTSEARWLGARFSGRCALLGSVPSSGTPSAGDPVRVRCCCPTRGHQKLLGGSEPGGFQKKMEKELDLLR